MSGNSTVRFYENSTYSDHTPEEIIAKGLNSFLGWKCSVGINGLFIDWNGNVYPGTCLMRPQDSLGNIQENFSLHKEWVTCGKKLCHCNIEITLPKYSQSSDQETAERVDMDSLSRSEAVISPTAVMPALRWDRDSKYIMWALGRRCNYHCSYCDDNSHSKTDPFFSREVLFNTLEKIQNEFAGGKRIRFAFTGGEPTIHPNYLEFVKAIHDLGHLIGTTSNGSHLPNYYAELMKYSTINFSVHFEFVKDDKFIKVIERVLHEKKTDPHLAKRWIDIRLMIKPGGLPRAKELLEKLQALEGFKELIFTSLVPIRTPNSNVMMNYAEDEMRQLQSGMLA